MSTDLSRVIHRAAELNVGVVETCACGASIELLRAYQQREQLAEWRANHRHDMSAAVERERAAATTHPAPTPRGATDDQA